MKNTVIAILFILLLFQTFKKRNVTIDFGMEMLPKEQIIVESKTTNFNLDKPYTGYYNISNGKESANVKITLAKSL